MFTIVVGIKRETFRIISIVGTSVCGVRWDECVPEPRILKFSDANLLKQKELQSLHPE